METPKECTICLELITETNSTCFECGHSFHSSCIMEYSLKCAATHQDVHCPLCRKLIIKTENTCNLHHVIGVLGTTATSTSPQQHGSMTASNTIIDIRDHHEDDFSISSSPSIKLRTLFVGICTVWVVYGGLYYLYRDIIQ